MTVPEFIAPPVNLNDIPFAHSGKSNVYSIRGVIPPTTLIGDIAYIRSTNTNDPGNFPATDYKGDLSAGPPNGAALEWKIPFPMSVAPDFSQFVTFSTIIGPNIGNVVYSVDGTIIGSMDGYAAGGYSIVTNIFASPFAGTEPKVRNVRITHAQRNPASTDNYYVNYNISVYSTLP